MKTISNSSLINTLPYLISPLSLLTRQGVLTGEGVQPTLWSVRP